MCVSQPNESAVMLRLMMFADMHVTHMLFAFSESGALARSTLRSIRCCVSSIQRTGSLYSLYFTACQPFVHSSLVSAYTVAKLPKQPNAEVVAFCVRPQPSG